MTDSTLQTELGPKRVSDGKEFGKVAVLFGGDSAEREVSLSSGEAVLAGLRAGGIDAHGIDKDERVLETLRTGRFDRVFNVLHGRGGEDGTLQGALDTMGLPYTGSDVLACALAMDKVRTKLVWQALGIPTPESVRVSSERELEAAADELGFPLAVKPVHEGSSVGVGRAEDGEGLLSAWWQANEYDNEVLIEHWVEGVEYTAAMLDGAILPLIKLETPRTFYDYDAKYADDSGTRYTCPCGLDEQRERRILKLAARAFDAIGVTGWGRVDLLCNEDGAPFFIDVNTAPGMTSHSLVPIAAAHKGIDFDELVWRVLESSL